MEQKSLTGEVARGATAGGSLMPAQRNGGGQPGTVKTNQLGDLERRSTGETAVSQVEAAAKAEIQAKYIMALQRPRDEDLSRDKILRVCNNLRFAESAMYKKPVGDNKTVDGPSIRFAEEMIKRWGNIDVRQYVMNETDEIRNTRVMVTDLETNISYTKDVVIRKTVERKNNKGRDVIEERLNSYGKVIFIVRATDDEVMMKESALVSKAIRNNGLRLIPQHIIEEAMEIVERTVKANIDQDPDKNKRQILDAFSRNLNITPDKLKLVLNKDLDVLTPAEITKLRSIYTTIKDGQATIDDYITKTEKETTTAKGDLASFQPGDANSHTDVKESFNEQTDKGSEKDSDGEDPYAKGSGLLLSKIYAAKTDKDLAELAREYSRNLTSFTPAENKLLQDALDQRAVVLKQN